MNVEFLYKNHKGEKALRIVHDVSIEYIPTPGFDYQPGWFLSGICQTKMARRSFALTHIVIPQDGRFYKVREL